MSDDSGSARADKHNKAMEKQKANVDAGIAAAQEQRGVAVLLTGDGKGKSSSAFGMVIRALGYGQSVGIVQFIKGEQLSGEELFVRDQLPQVELVQMGTGFTWDTQDYESDKRAAEETWVAAERMLANSDLDLVILDELTYMLAYQYLDEQRVLDAITARPMEQSVVVTGRGGGSGLQAIMDTVSEVKDVKHAYAAGIMARRGVDY